MTRISDHPLFLCGFRPFYLATATYGLLLLAAWSAMLAGVLPMPAVPGGAVAWHVHELLYGFAMASVAGFLLTAVPEFTGCAIVDRRRLLYLSLLWLAGRVAYWLSGSLGIWPAAALNLAFAAWLMVLFAPPSGGTRAGLTWPSCSPWRPWPPPRRGFISAPTPWPGSMSPRA